MTDVLSRWMWEPSILWLIVVQIAVYAYLVGPLCRFKRRQPVPVVRQCAFYLGTLVMGIALVSPLDTIADHYLFSAHTLQHLLLTFVAPPLWIIGIPSWLIESLPDSMQRVWRRLTHPIVAFIGFNATMWLWHIPALYDAALQSEALHIVEHGAFMLSAIIGWWPVLGSTNRQAPPVRVLYLALSLFPCTALAMLITFAPHTLYPFYASAPRLWDVTLAADQEIGGVVMWAVGDLAYMALILAALYGWLSSGSDFTADSMTQEARGK